MNRPPFSDDSAADFEETLITVMPEDMAETPVPATLDIFRVDGRFAQLLSTSGAIRYLDDGSDSRIDFPKYRLARQFKGDIGMFQTIYPGQISDAEIRNAYYDAQSTGFHHKLQITFFGEYQKR